MNYVIMNYEIISDRCLRIVLIRDDNGHVFMTVWDSWGLITDWRAHSHNLYTYVGLEEEDF